MTTISHYSSINDLLSKLSPEHRFLVEKARTLLLKYGAKETLKSIHICYKFPNNMRFYLNSYKKKFPILSCNCYRIFDEYPMLQHLFDAQAKYITKIFLRNEDVFQQKAIEQLIKLTSESKPTKNSL
ncbi:TPA: hypothetical protein DIC40_05655 [Patescibacteria group bacterium]|nr:hypothetical protein P148_SR1C00001G0681 [candidate division SR1 bacterium RAAC1_SR1_1]HCY21300.1 hypothetical protein [Candidatus Gracilibacteria bacterium]